MFDNVLQEGGEFISCESDIDHFPRLTHQKIAPLLDVALSSNVAGRHWLGNWWRPGSESWKIHALPWPSPLL